MIILYDYYPKFGDKNSVNITYTGGNSPTFFGIDNLFSIEPVKSFKTGNTNQTIITMEFNDVIRFDTVFLNRINFTSYIVNYSLDGESWINFSTVSSLEIDEVNDEQYVHNISVSTPVRAKFIQIIIPSITPLFETNYFKIGNILVGMSIEVSNPKNGFQVKYVPSMSVTTFKSGYITTEKLGRTRRTFSGDFDKLNVNELNKFRLTYKPVVLYLDYTENTQSCYLVMNTEEFTQSYDFAKVKSMNFKFEEIV